MPEKLDLPPETLAAIKKVFIFVRGSLPKIQATIESLPTIQVISNLASFQRMLSNTPPLPVCKDLFLDNSYKYLGENELKIMLKILGDGLNQIDYLREHLKATSLSTDNEKLDLLEASQETVRLKDLIFSRL